MDTVKTSSTYTVVDTTDVLLTVIFGNAQFGSSRVERENGTIIRIGEVVKLVLGRGSALRGTKIRVVSTVTDINPSSNLLSVSYTLTGGVAPATVTETDDVSPNTSEKFEHLIQFV
jgi:hypothetical protein